MWNFIWHNKFVHRNHYEFSWIRKSQKEDSLMNKISDILVVKDLPEEIRWVRTDETTILDIEVKSSILISLPSIAGFIGVRTDNFVKWLDKSTFSTRILSCHYKHIESTPNEVPWRKGLISGLTAFIPFELLPEIIVAIRQSDFAPEFPEKVQMLYELSQTTLKAVGLAMSGDKEKASQELALVGKGLGLNIADQIIGIFKQYETRDYQVLTNKEFNSKVKAQGLDYATVTGTLTFGVTQRTVANWKALGKQKKLPSKLRTTGREVMRQVSPGDGVGMVFGEKHYIKEPKVNEAIKTGKQGKSFYERLKKVGLLENQK